MGHRDVVPFSVTFPACVCASPVGPWRTRIVAFGLSLLATVAGVGTAATNGDRGRGILELYHAGRLFNLNVRLCAAELFPSWKQARAFEKLALAEQLLGLFHSGRVCDNSGYEWSKGSDDLSLPSGRAKWGLENLLGVKIPGVIDRSTSNEEVDKIGAEAARLVEAYRSGILALAADHRPSPQEFADLKQKYMGKIVPWKPDKYVESTYAGK